VMTHAFFKALLFLGAGSVIHALSGEQDLRKMGGLAKKIPITCTVLFVAGLAIAGVPPFSGHYSKDAILEATYEHSPWMYWLGVFTASMTAFYVFRALFLTFFGEYRGNVSAHGDHGHGHNDHGHGHGGIHESPPVMWIPLAILAVLSAVGGFINIPRFLEPIFPVAEGGTPEWLGYVAIAAGLGGIAVAFLFYVVSPGLPEGLARAFSLPYRWVYNKYFVDEFYDAAVVNPVVDGSRELLWRVGDVQLIDGAVNGAGKTAQSVGGLLRRAQSGYIRSYAAWVVAGSILVIAIMGLRGAW
jgi:NADH-quinone oxidoreductase subunit L